MHSVEMTWNETYTCLLPWRLGLGARSDDGRPNSESNTSSRVVELGEGFGPLVVCSRVTSNTQSYQYFRPMGYAEHAIDSEKRTKRILGREAEGLG